MNQIIDLKRMKYLIRADILQGIRNLPIITVGLMGIIILKSVVQAVLKDGNIDSGFESIQNFLIPIGIIVTSYAFNEMHKKNKCDDFILIPASIVEKILSRLILTTIILPFFLITLILLSKFIAGIFNLLVLNIRLELYNPFNMRLGRFLLIFLIAQQIVFLGAAWFKKLHLIKTFLICVALITLLAILALIVFRLLFPGMSSEVHMHVLDDKLYLLAMKFLDPVLKIIKFIFFGLLAPFCWIVAWMRVKEVQSHYAV